MNSARQLWLIIVLIFSPVSLPAQQRPLVTEDPRLIPTGTLAVETGMGYFVRTRFPVSGLGGNELQVPVTGLHFGLGDRSEFQITGNLHHFLWVKENGSGRRNDWGDFGLSTKIKLVDQTRFRPIISFRPTVILPNSNKTKGIGTDTMQVFGSLLIGKNIGSVFVFGSAGLGILDDTLQAAKQQDVLAYGVAALVPVGSHVSIAGEWNGIENPQENPTPGAEDRSQIRLGAQIRLGGVRWDVAATAGLTRLDHRAGLVLGITKEFRLWQ